MCAIKKPWRSLGFSSAPDDDAVGEAYYRMVFLKSRYVDVFLESASLQFKGCRILQQLKCCFLWVSRVAAGPQLAGCTINPNVVCYAALASWPNRCKCSFPIRMGSLWPRLPTISVSIFCGLARLGLAVKECSESFVADSRLHISFERWTLASPHLCS